MIIKARTKKLIEDALKEDIGAGDITSSSILPKKQQGKFIIFCNEQSILCGITLAEASFNMIDDNIHFRPLVKDGAQVQKARPVAHIEGNCQTILSAERVALNFLGWLSGISTLTGKFVDQVKDYKAQIMDTRKTIPTLRYLQKYAVKIGGGKNHRMGLYDQVLIKDNHLSAISEQDKTSYVKDAIERARKNAPKNKEIEIEIKTISEFKQALSLDPDIIMLDNMKIEQIKEAVAIRDSYRIKKQDIGFKALLEVSGNVNLNNVKEIAACGVDRISIGALTHSAPSIDFSLKAE